MGPCAPCASGRPYVEAALGQGVGSGGTGVSTLGDRLAVWPQYLLPQQALTQFMGRLAGARGGAATTAAIAWFIRRYRVDMSLAAQPDPAAYATFNEFFTRALRPEVRPLGSGHWLCPVDGAVSQYGELQGDRLVQAKGHTYRVAELLGGDDTEAAAWQGPSASFATIYLSPRDYHRIHMPAAGRLLRMVHVPGALFSVNPLTARAVPGLFARNERVVCLFEGEHGPWVLVLVGATIVGSMATVWHGVVNPPRPQQVRTWDYREQNITLQAGQEMGRFLLGSTVVLLMPGPLRFASHWAPGAAVCMGQDMAQRVDRT